MTTAQLAAIRKLETALGHCALQGVCLRGRGGSLVAYDRILHDEALADHRTDVEGALNDLERETDARVVEDHGAYIDSGA